MEDILVNGDKLRRLRQKRRWSQIDLARVSGTDQGTISRLETGNQGDTRIDTLVRIARALSIPTDDLFVRAEPAEVAVANPEIDVFMHLVEDMTPEERASAESYIRFVLHERRASKPRKKKR